VRRLDSHGTRLAFPGEIDRANDNAIGSRDGIVWSDRLTIYIGKYLGQLFLGESGCSIRGGEKINALVIETNDYRSIRICIHTGISIILQSYSCESTYRDCSNLRRYKRPIIVSYRKSYYVRMKVFRIRNYICSQIIQHGAFIDNSHQSWLPINHAYRDDSQSLPID